MIELVVHIPLEPDTDLAQAAPVIDARDASGPEPGIVIDDGIPLSYDCSSCGRALVSGDASYWLAGVRIRCADCGSISIVPRAPRPARVEVAARWNPAVDVSSGGPTPFGTAE